MLTILIDPLIHTAGRWKVTFGRASAPCSSSGHQPEWLAGAFFGNQKPENRAVLKRDPLAFVAMGHGAQVLPVVGPRLSTSVLPYQKCSDLGMKHHTLHVKTFADQTPLRMTPWSPGHPDHLHLEHHALQLPACDLSQPQQPDLLAAAGSVVGGHSSGPWKPRRFITGGSWITRGFSALDKGREAKSATRVSQRDRAPF